MELSLVQSVFGARRGGCWEPTSLVEVCVIARGLWPLSQLLSGRSLFSFVVFFLTFPLSAFCRAEMETIRGENPHLGFSVGSAVKLIMCHISCALLDFFFWGGGEGFAYF